MAGAEDVNVSIKQKTPELETAFVCAMDAADVYVSSYEQLHGRLKEVR